MNIFRVIIILVLVTLLVTVFFALIICRFNSRCWWYKRVKKQKEEEESQPLAYPNDKPIANEKSASHSILPPVTNQGDAPASQKQLQKSDGSVSKEVEKSEEKEAKKKVENNPKE